MQPVDAASDARDAVLGGGGGGGVSVANRQTALWPPYTTFVSGRREASRQRAGENATRPSPVTHHNYSQ